VAAFLAILTLAWADIGVRVGGMGVPGGEMREKVL
jgi:hypothetical protein